MRITLVVPVFNESTNITEFAGRIAETEKILEGDTLEILFVDDGSTDDTIAQIVRAAQSGVKCGYISLSRRFGHQAAMEAGIGEASGDAVITMDGDLQHPPAEIPAMIKAHKEGYDVVHMCRFREKRMIKNITSWSFYRLYRLNRGDNRYIVPGDFRLISNRVAGIMRHIPEKNKIFRVLIPELGFRQKILYYDQPKRFSGKPKYSVNSSFSLATNILFRFGTLPLSFVFWLGLTMSVASFLAGVWKIIDKLFISDNIVPGYTDTIVAILFLSGCILLAIGINGNYLRLLIEQTRNMPTFIIREKSLYNDKRETPER